MVIRVLYGIVVVVVVVVVVAAVVVVVAVVVFVVVVVVAVDVDVVVIVVVIVVVVVSKHSAQPPPNLVHFVSLGLVYTLVQPFLSATCYAGKGTEGHTFVLYCCCIHAILYYCMI